MRILIKKLENLIGLRFIKESRKSLGIIAPRIDLNCVLRSCMEKKLDLAGILILGIVLHRHLSS